MLFGSLTVPDGLTTENYARAAEQLMPHAVNGVALELGEALVSLHGELSAPKARQQLTKTLALCIGVGRTGSELPELRVASDDAQAFSDFLRVSGANGVSPQTGGLPGRNITTLVERAPSRARVLETLKERASHAGPDDLLLLYYAGYGLELGGHAYLVPYDLDPEAPAESALSLAEIDRALSDCRARQVVILDASFGGRARAGEPVRTLDAVLLRSAGDEPAAPADVAADLERFARRRTVLLGAGAKGVASELSPIPEDKKGLFTSRRIAAGHSEAADTDRDGVLSVQEVFGAAGRETTRLSARVGLRQVPELLGADDEGRKLLLARPGQP
jgi:hypothetical protein